jgi:hypothetical protein
MGNTVLKKSLITLIIGLFFMAGVSPGIGGEFDENISFSEIHKRYSNNRDQVDQQQTEYNFDVNFRDNFWKAQSFKPNLSTLSKVDLRVNKVNLPTHNLDLHIRSSLYLSDLRFCSLSPDLIPNSSDWVEFYFANLNVNTNETYYIILSSNETDGFYSWGASTNDLYSRGEAYSSFNYGVTWHEELEPVKDFCFKTYSDSVNQPPNPPSNPYPSNGATNIDVNAILSWTCSDPDGDNLTYDVYFGDMPPLEKIASNITTNSCYPGTLMYGLTHYWNVVAWDEHGFSTTGPAWDFTTREAENNPPITPIIDGPTSGKPGEEYTYCIPAVTDPDGDDIHVYWDWGDGTNSGWLGPFESGQEVCENHSWDEKGKYVIKARLKDEAGTESGWATLDVNIPRTGTLHNFNWLSLLERIPFVRQLLSLMG